MDFVHQTPKEGDTIAAIATPPGSGGVAIIRISGPNALDLADRFFSGKVKSYTTHTAHYGKVLGADGEVIDDALLLVMLGEKSYTGEDTVEVHCHGGSLIARAVLETFITGGARMAQPGEFTFRAFMSGKLDLAQAEAVQELIAAQSSYALNAAGSQLQGALSKKIQGFQHDLTDIAAILEAWVDFPEEDLEFAPREELCEKLSDAEDSIKRLLDTFHDGKVAHDGITMCLVGAPNVGKSSIMNVLLGKDRAIVTHIPGTTRDVLEDNIKLNDLHFRLLDTAGIRDDAELIEREGIRKTHEAIQEADLILFVLDVTKGIEAFEAKMLAELPHNRTICVWNKKDMPHEALESINIAATVEVSALQNKGFDDLKNAIDKIVWDKGPPSKEEVLVTSTRHKEALAHALEAASRVREGLTTDVSPEFLASDMRECLNALGSIIGTNITEDILTTIFSKFCVGK
ncbi:MAG: tRNA uridine-5-carboxymethylaminomethyl(34) synthesis GTPase MnmE [Waddliaceae bacterium]|jgi:tRNA modification GTPase|nr:tRNA uridine-5-carboxymethylaminomethyl(34) synthesis GTPase MnmE [Waddliaceae bacterium]MBT3579153.1 tRNA uridine-5-carboxymethylaminomethyl(34) synthesis GTPase MnmE [Waddliaceae bacterium]MBT4444309.1 tRNA uridine-5-carboxymethylaminomethyl(34) synthesis GTPase MnmE [Waddliaceae bacterium]MBT6928524.1 tRNA uridine-5-carboxymethylaminomethyl(34) synthesis GTPase MnmE [Waddliaceae bacterium]MBT7264862.1 tRNA uridine-5-carboxymethylaminomethyl(34) synthesis GTPase MnmE [Waddliaceae bacterium